MKIKRVKVAAQLVLFILAISQVAVASSFQHPLVPSDTDVFPSFPSTTAWNFNFSSSAPHYFASFQGLLKQWPNTFFPNGHSVAPCEIPAFTKLYHGRRDGDVPPSPEWVAFDIGMSYGIMGGSRNSHMLTYQTTRLVNCLYFDGESATLMGSGQLDTQMLHIWGNTSGPAREGNRFGGLWEEYARALGLCDWIEERKLGGSGWGLEGIVRMNAGFEMIWCNFSSPSIRLISHLNVTAPLLPNSYADEADKEVYFGARSQDRRGASTSYCPLPPDPTNTERATDPTNPPSPPNWRRDMKREPFFRTQTWNWFLAGVNHYGNSGSGSGLGETRVRNLGCGFMNYYAPKFTSAALSRANIEQRSLNLTDDGLWKGPGENGTRYGGLTALMRRRRAHTLGHVSPGDAAIMRRDSERVFVDLLNNPTKCSGMDWNTITNEIVQSYSSSLMDLLKRLQRFEKISLNNETAMRDWAFEVRDQMHSLLLPFLEYQGNVSEKQWDRDSVLFKETFSRCCYHHTRLLDPNEGVHLGPEEANLKWAVEETSSGICTVLVDIGLSMEGLWAANFNEPSKTSLPLSSKLTKEITRWKEGVEELMSWLGWAGEWADCERKCAWDEKCYIPMWPLIHMPNFGSGPGRRPGEERPAYGNPGWGPGNGDLSPSNGTEWPPRNGTGARPGGGFRWQADESDLWQPKCVKYDYLAW